MKIALQLTGKAQQAYAAMKAKDAGNYQLVKEAILRRNNISEQTYRQRFRDAVMKKDKMVSELNVRLTDLFLKWTKGCKTVEQLGDLMILEQLVNALQTEVRVWVMERMPKLVLAEQPKQSWDLGAELDEAIFQGGRQRPTQTRSHRRQKRHEHSRRVCSELPAETGLNISASELQNPRRLTQLFQTLREVSGREVDSGGGSDVSVVVKNGLMYSVKARSGELPGKEQLVLPNQYRCGGLKSLYCNGDFPHGPIVVLCAGRRCPTV